MNMATQKKKLLKIASYNVNGILNLMKRSKILGKMKKEGVGVALLQETHLSEREHEKLKRNGYQYFRLPIEQVIEEEWPL